ncbi:MAG: hypothetical protein ACRDK0_01390 [Solirubrobacteraceae bacterium]
MRNPLRNQTYPLAEAMLRADSPTYVAVMLAAYDARLQEEYTAKLEAMIPVAAIRGAG